MCAQEPNQKKLLQLIFTLMQGESTLGVIMVCHFIFKHILKFIVRVKHLCPEFP